jgi:hypothetical protein
MAGSSTPHIGPADDAVVVTEVYLEAEIKVDQETPVSALLDGGDRKAVSMGR